MSIRADFFTHDESGTPTNSSPACGDGFKLITEGCDDGNTSSGDGCSATCEVESGWNCTETITTYPDTLEFAVTYRDFVESCLDGGHPHFGNSEASCTETSVNPSTGADQRIVGALCTEANYSTTTIDKNHCGLLNSSGKPRGFDGNGNTNNVSPELVNLWFADENTTATNPNGDVVKLVANPGYAIDRTSYQEDNFDEDADPIYDTLTLTHQGGGSYRYDSGVDELFPLDERGFGISQGRTHNYNFTTELRYFFQYQGGEQLTFRGDDDVFIYINGRLAVDLGGIHCAHRGRVVLGDDEKTGNDCDLYETSIGCAFGGYGEVTACAPDATELLNANLDDDRFDLTVGQVYEIALFHAERQPTGSNFRLDLSGFLAPRSTCSTNCGDGIAAGNEVCDTNSGLSDGYNTCLGDCSINFCGDGVVQSTNGGDETCDTAVKVTYQADGNGCGFDCQTAPSCGDAIIQASAGEVCDDGTNDGSYGSCSPDCRSFGGYCGDGTSQDSNGGTEFCDTAVKVTYQADGNGCGFDCQQAPFCGDGVRNGPETCEPAGTTTCDSECQIQPFCGDGIVSPTEECDDGSFNQPTASVGYGACDVNCEKGPRCGDGVTQADAGEECDDADLNSDAQNPLYDSCTTACLFGPRCGDGIEQAGEDCDNGYNEDTYAYSAGACGPNCTAVSFCGDGEVNPAVEQCDAGDANADDAYDGCTSACLWGPFCGDGVVQMGEECDDPEGNVAYSADGEGCSFECTTELPFCGDGTRNSSEECDEGAGENIGEYGGCQSNCERASFCGDGVVDDEENEECDDGPAGSLECSTQCKERDTVIR